MGDKKSLCHTPKKPTEQLNVLFTEGLLKRGFIPSEGLQGDSMLGPGHLRLIYNSAVDGSLGTTELCATTLGQGLEAKVRQKGGLGSDTGSNNVLEVMRAVFVRVWSPSPLC